MKCVVLSSARTWLAMGWMKADSRRSRNFQAYVKEDLYSYEGVFHIYSTVRHNPGTYGPVRSEEKVSALMCERGPDGLS